MKTTLTLVLAGFIAICAAVGALALHQAPSVPGQVLGGTSPIDQTNYHCWAGVCHYYGSMAINTATSTACAIQGPAGTSTVGAFGIRIDTASSTATNWFTGSGATQFATSSSLGNLVAVAASAQAFIQGSTSPAVGSNTVLGPNTWLIWKNNLGVTAGDPGTGFVPSGRCYAVFTALQS